MVRDATAQKMLETLGLVGLEALVLSLFLQTRVLRAGPAAVAAGRRA